MKHFNAVVEQLKQMHQDVNTIYAPTKMFHSANELSFAISRLMDAAEVLTSESLEYDELTPALRTIWFDIRDTLPKETAQNLAICIINNTPLSKTDEEITSIKNLFYSAMHDFTDNKELSNAFTDIFFTEKEGQDIKKRQFNKKKRKS